jgi:hypothetical protein
VRELHNVLIRQKRAVLQKGPEADERGVHQAGDEHGEIGYLGGSEAFEYSRAVGVTIRKRRAPEVFSFEVRARATPPARPRVLIRRA